MVNIMYFKLSLFCMVGGVIEVKCVINCSNSFTNDSHVFSSVQMKIIFAQKMDTRKSSINVEQCEHRSWIYIGSYIVWL